MAMKVLPNLLTAYYQKLLNKIKRGNKMSAKLIDGKLIASKIRENLKIKVKELKAQGIIPHLTVILIGADPASHSYVRGKERASKEIGMSSEIIKMDASITEDELLHKIKELNDNKAVHGILVQLPLPGHIDEQRVIETISPEKDVDGFHPINIGKMLIGQETFLPCTPFGIMRMLEMEEIDVSGKHVVVVGRSNIVGKPMGQLLLNKDATVTYCHSRTKNLRH